MRQLTVSEAEAMGAVVQTYTDTLPAWIGGQHFACDQGCPYVPSILNRPHVHTDKP